MKRFLLISVAVYMCLTAQRCEAFNWSALTNFFNTAAANTTTVQNNAKTETEVALTNIQKQALDIDTAVQNNFLEIVSMLSAKKETNSIKSQLNSILNNNSTTETEKSELINQILAAYVTNLVNNKSATTSAIKKLSTSQKLELVQNITSIEQSGQKYAALAKQAITASASNVIKSTSSSNTTADDIASIISQTNQTASLIKTKAANAVNLANQLKSVAEFTGLIK